MSRLIRMGESVLRRLVGSKTLTISWVTPYVAVGGEVDASLRSELLDAGITIIVDVRKCFDESMNPIRSKIQTLVWCLPSEKELESNGNKILFHCQAGIDRSPFIAMYYHWCYGARPSLMNHYNIVKSARPQTVIHDDWVRMFE